MLKYIRNKLYFALMIANTFIIIKIYAKFQNQIVTVNKIKKDYIKIFFVLIGYH